MRKLAVLLAVVIAAAAVVATTATAAPKISYSGQGMNDITGPTTSKCGTPDNGGTGVTLVPGQQYLLWVLNGSITGTPVLHIPDGQGSFSDFPMKKVGGTWKVVTSFYPKGQLVGPPAAYADGFTGTPNNLVVSHGCGVAKSYTATDIHKGLADDGEPVVVSGALDLGAKVHDLAKITTDNNVALPAGSTVKFAWFLNNTCTSTPESQSDALDAAASVDNGLPKGPLGAGDYSYQATFTSADKLKVLDSVGPCEPLHVNKGQLEITTHIHSANHGDIGGAVHAPLGSIVHDTATVTGAVAGIDPTGAVGFTLNGNAVGNDGTDAVNGGVKSKDSAPLAAGSYTYGASVAGDANYDGDLSDPEPLTVDKGALKIQTTIHGVNTAHGPVTSVALGSTVHDTATVSGQVGSFPIPGADDVSFTLTDKHNANPAAVAKDPAADGAATARTVESDPLHAGSYSYQAHVDGNSNYTEATSDPEPLEVKKANLVITTTIHDASHNPVTEVNAGAKVHDTATVSVEPGAYDGFTIPGAGDVSFTFDAGSIGQGAGESGFTANSAEVDTTSLPDGTHNFNASVLGNDDYAGATSAQEQIRVNAVKYFCSPGFWKNASDAAWALTGHSRADSFNSTVVPSFYDTAIGANPTLDDVLGHGANFYGGVLPPFGMNPFNAVGAYLTEEAGFYNGGSQVDKCPISNGGQIVR